MKNDRRFIPFLLGCTGCVLTFLPGLLPEIRAASTLPDKNIVATEGEVRRSLAPKPKQAVPEQPAPEQAVPEQAVPEQAVPEQAVPDQPPSTAVQPAPEQSVAEPSAPDQPQSTTVQPVPEQPVAESTSQQSFDSPSSTVPLLLFTEATQVLREKCMPCHTKDYTIPLYGKIPGLGKLVERDYKQGLRHVNFAAELAPGGQGKPVGEVFLAKVERALEDKRMPPPQYLSAYLSAQLNDSEKGMIRKWIEYTRLKHYATGLAAEEFSTEPIQPLPDSVPVDNRKAALGELLFYSPKLSGDSSLTCASCHFLNSSGADGEQTSRGITGALLPYNSPTVFNAVFNLRQFWSGQAHNLQDQARIPPSNALEMGSDWDTICKKLSESPVLVAAFQEIYPDGIQPQNVTNAIAAFESTLITPNSRFDRYLKGDKEAISEVERGGYTLFKQSRCATCHVGKSMGGQSVEYLNLKGDFYGDRNLTLRESDLGLYMITGREEDKFRFKTPNLRNVTETGPWYHDGHIKNLQEAVYLMGLYQSGINLDEQSVDLLVQFLHTLTGEYKGKRVRK